MVRSALRSQPSICTPATTGWTCASWKPGASSPPRRSTTSVPASARERTSFSPATARIRPPATATAASTGAGPVPVNTFPPTNTVSARCLFLDIDASSGSAGGPARLVR